MFLKLLILPSRAPSCMPNALTCCRKQSLLVSLQRKAASPEIEDTVLSVMLVGTVFRLQSSGIDERNHESILKSLAAF